jgi:hypothetical protein
LTVTSPDSPTLATVGLLLLYSVPLLRVLRSTVAAFSRMPVAVNCAVWPAESLLLDAETPSAIGTGVAGRQRIGPV